MSNLDHAPYAAPLRSTWASTTGVAHRAREGDINRSVAALGSSDHEALRWSIVRMITPSITDADIERSGRVPYVTESGNGVDWVVQYPDTGTVLGICEHKPLGAPAHGAWASHWLLSDEKAVTCDDGYLDEVAANLQVLDRRVFTREQLSDLRFWTFKTVPGGMRSSMDQVLKYRNDYDGRFPCHILSDQGTTVNEIYRARGKGAPPQPYSYKTEVFPVHTTASALNELAAALTGVELTVTERSNVTQVVDAMWMRGPQSLDDQLNDRAKALVSDAARDAGYNHETEWIRTNSQSEQQSAGPV